MAMMSVEIQSSLRGPENRNASADQLIHGDIRLNRRTRRVFRAGREIGLSPTEFRLLAFLMKCPGEVYSRAQLIAAIWGRPHIDERAIDVNIGRLRKAIKRGQEADPIRTVRGIGYAFDEYFGAAV